MKIKGYQFATLNNIRCKSITTCTFRILFIMFGNDIFTRVKTFRK
ncbi:[Citrate [pro-3S]-lyase] ligase [Escherichia coli ISC7]|uniref:[Citrate [pro-3S]-lyase] ligase n=1 Tax=Escherichia coli ISC7 TaxID=1432555 RepID=W1EXA6_ECOLX|nr:[Citrate [pro-3S]-lyase] ligase [Escherichia coli ISC7]